MITLKTLEFSNIFSYGENNKIDLEANQITQIIGKNGHGKSSIPLILEECLFNKNSKNIKRGDVLNRYSKAKNYSIKLTFDKDGEIYTVLKSKDTVKLIKGDIDISAHTATNTYKLIETLIGLDHKSFSQLIYQSSAGSLEFLTATDTTRKKFLIDLLNLQRYTEAFEVFKSVGKELSDTLTSVSSRAETIKAWIDKHSKISLEPKEILEVPEDPRDLSEEVAVLTEQLRTIKETNTRITKNNEYKTILSNIVVETYPKPEGDLNTLIAEKAEYTKTINDSTTLFKKYSGKGSTCHTCGQHIDNSKELELATVEKDKIQIATDKLAAVVDKITKYNNELDLYNRAKKSQEDFEKYHGLYNPNEHTELLDASEISSKITALEIGIRNINDTIKSATAKNNEAYAHNSKIEVIKSQMIEMQEDLAVQQDLLSKLQDRLNIIQLLQKTFSTNGLVAYKIECLIKDLEDLTNQYLSELSNGRFQISFRVNNDKLNVIILDNGTEVDILALSGGERARVNTATLLAIRRLMQSLSNVRINLLVLDETIDSLDTEGKERLVEVLLNEEHLNTFLISHGYTHPLLEKLHVVKEHNISRIDS